MDYRKKINFKNLKTFLRARFNQREFTDIEKFKFFVLFSGGPTKAEVLQAFDEADVNHLPWVQKIRQFLEEYIVEGFEFERGDRVFPAGMIPFAGPSYDLIGYLMRTPRAEHTIEKLLRACPCSFGLLTLDRIWWKTELMGWFKRVWIDTFGPLTNPQDREDYEQLLVLLRGNFQRLRWPYKWESHVPFTFIRTGQIRTKYTKRDILAWMYQVEIEACWIGRFDRDHPNESIMSPELLKEWDFEERIFNGPMVSPKLVKRWDIEEVFL
ncbi:hypothetical protein QBC38DRAFT_465311, partial [Podospora fimiseda]